MTLDYSQVDITGTYWKDGESTRKAFFTIGQEGSGTYMLHNAIVNSSNNDDHIAMRVSVPHAHRWPEIRNIIEDLFSKGYYVLPIIIMREKVATLNSINARDKTRILTDMDYHARLSYIMEQTAPFSMHLEMITYEAFVTSESFRRNFFDRIGLPYPEGMQIYNANEKYYGEKE